MACRVLGFSKAGVLRLAQESLSLRDLDEAHLINAALDIHAGNPEFGYRFIADELHGRCIAAGENKVARLCSKQRIWSALSKKRVLSRKAGPSADDDLVARPFSAEGVYSTRIVGCSMGSRMTASLAVSALCNAIALHSPTETVVVNSDQGSSGPPRWSGR